MDPFSEVSANTFGGTSITATSPDVGYINTSVAVPWFPTPTAGVTPGTVQSLSGAGNSIDFFFAGSNGVAAGDGVRFRD